MAWNFLSYISKHSHYHLDHGLQEGQILGLDNLFICFAPADIFVQVLVTYWMIKLVQDKELSQVKSQFIQMYIVYL